MNISPNVTNSKQRTILATFQCVTETGALHEYFCALAFDTYTTQYQQSYCSSFRGEYYTLYIFMPTAWNVPTYYHTNRTSCKDFKGLMFSSRHVGNDDQIANGKKNDIVWPSRHASKRICLYYWKKSCIVHFLRIFFIKY